MNIQQFARSMKCAWCHSPVHQVSPYCCELCREKGKHVRYGRARLEDGSFWNEDIIQAIHTKVKSVSEGGYSFKGHKIPDRTRRMVLARETGLCQHCGSPGREIHHMSGHSNAPSDLLYLCKLCHDKLHGQKKWDSNQTLPSVGITMSEDEWRLSWIDEIKSLSWGNEFIRFTFRKQPQKKCHDHIQWNELQQVICRERRSLLR